jgi:hypothetical protein
MINVISHYNMPITLFNHRHSSTPRWEKSLTLPENFVFFFFFEIEIEMDRKAANLQTIARKQVDCSKPFELDEAGLATELVVRLWRIFCWVYTANHELCIHSGTKFCINGNRNLFTLFSCTAKCRERMKKIGAHRNK